MYMRYVEDDFNLHNCRWYVNITPIAGPGGLERKLNSPTQKS